MIHGLKTGNCTENFTNNTKKQNKSLRKYNPYMYHQMLRVQQKRETLKERLKHCRTKLEAQQAIGIAFSTIGEKNPMREAMVAAVQNVSKQFCSSEKYKKLPDTEEEQKRRKEIEISVSNPFKEEEDCDEYETIQYSFGSYGYQEANTGIAEESAFTADI